MNKILILYPILILIVGLLTIVLTIIGVIPPVFSANTKDVFAKISTYSAWAFAGVCFLYLLAQGLLERIKERLGAKYSNVENIIFEIAIISVYSFLALTIISLNVPIFIWLLCLLATIFFLLLSIEAIHKKRM
ncbi:MAG: hypothetical protein CVV56_02055 [Tenericutes bacterium HGW-Tenericutes-1]|nr:MAG: hypothetical protein CVV56_02055 [Tenericutes bacterium HGW-Tenericutes-1]